LALNKKSAGIRPTAIGFNLRRLASKCAFGTNQLKSLFHPRQLGVGIPGGCEAAIHSALRFIEVVVKLDFTNAFNHWHRYDRRFTVEFRNFTLIAALLTVAHPLCFTAHTPFRPRKGPDKVTVLAPCCSAILFSHCYPH